MEFAIGHRIAAAICLLAATIPGAALASAQTETKGEAVAPPRMKIEQDRVDVGEVIRGEAVAASFVVRNVGGETLRILKAKPG